MYVRLPIVNHVLIVCNILEPNKHQTISNHHANPTMDIVWLYQMNHTMKDAYYVTVFRESCLNFDKTSRAQNIPSTNSD